MVEHLLIAVLEEKWHLGFTEAHTCYSRDLLTGKLLWPHFMEREGRSQVLRGAGQWRTWMRVLGGTPEARTALQTCFLLCLLPSSCRTSCSSHPASVVSHKCSEHLCSVNLEHLPPPTHTCPQAGLTQGSQSQVERLAAGVQVRSSTSSAPT